MANISSGAEMCWKSVTHVVVQAARGLFDNPAVVVQGMGGEGAEGPQCWEIGFARMPCDFKILFGPLA